MSASANVAFESASCSIVISRPAANVIHVRFAGHDVGGFGAGPMTELEKDLARGALLELFIDAGAAKGASMGVSGDWARWLSANKRRFRRVSMLTGSRFIQLSAEFVQRYSGLGETMRIYTDAEAFAAALEQAVG